MKQSVACPLPEEPRRVSLGEALQILGAQGVTYWLKALGIGAIAALIIGLPTRLIPNSLFIRMVPTTTADYIIYALSVALIGLTWALPSPAPHPGTERRSLFGGLGTFLAVGCPTCNKLVLLLLGSGGAMIYFAPLQPVLGAAALLLLATALRRRIGQLSPS